MRWFSHRRSPTPPGRHAMISSAAAYCLATAHALLCIVNGDDSAVFRFFLSPVTLTLTCEFGRDFCTLCLTAKFDRPTFSRSEVIMRINRQTDKQTDAAETSTSLRCATPVGNTNVRIYSRPWGGNWGVSKCPRDLSTLRFKLLYTTLQWTSL